MGLLDDAYIIVITGAKKAGKTDFGFWLLEEYHKRKWETCFMPFHEIPHKLLPKWIKQTDPTEPELEEGTVYFLDDFHLVHHARTGWNPEQINANKIMSIARHWEMKFIISTQITRQLDIANIYDVDIHFLRKPALGHVKAERQEVKSRVRAAQRHYIKELKEGKTIYDSVYYVTMDSEGVMRGENGEAIPQPEFWSEELSTYLRGVKRQTRKVVAR